MKRAACKYLEDDDKEARKFMYELLKDFKTVTIRAWLESRLLDGLNFGPGKFGPKRFKKGSSLPSLYRTRTLPKKSSISHGPWIQGEEAARVCVAKMILGHGSLFNTTKIDLIYWMKSSYLQIDMNCIRLIKVELILTAYSPFWTMMWRACVKGCPMSHIIH